MRLIQTRGRGAAAWGLLLSLAGAGPCAAADPEGLFSVDGVGTSRCSVFLEATQAKDAAKAQLFSSWASGLISGINLYAPDTYDLTPWQTEALIGAKLAAYCAANPDEQFANAVLKLVAVLSPERLRTASPVVQVRKGGWATVLYADTLSQIAERLRQKGVETSTDGGAYDEDLAQAIARFQKANDIPVTGLPDQATLNELFR